MNNKFQFKHDNRILQMLTAILSIAMCINTIIPGLSARNAAYFDLEASIGCYAPLLTTQNSSELGELEPFLKKFSDAPVQNIKDTCTSYRDSIYSNIENKDIFVFSNYIFQGRMFIGQMFFEYTHNSSIENFAIGIAGLEKRYNGLKLACFVKESYTDNTEIAHVPEDPEYVAKPKIISHRDLNFKLAIFNRLPTLSLFRLTMFISHPITSFKQTQTNVISLKSEYDTTKNSNFFKDIRVEFMIQPLTITAFTVT